MNKTKLITLSLVLILVLMGTAFAWWTQSTIINNKITTSNLDVIIKKTNEAPKILFTRNNLDNYNSLNIKKHYGAEVTKFEVPNNYTLNFEAKNMFPGSYVTYDFEIENTGIVPIKINDVKLIKNSETSISDEILNTLPITFIYRIKSKIGSYKISETVSGTYKDIAGKIKDAISVITLFEGDKITIGAIEREDVEFFNELRIEIPEYWDYNTEDSIISFSLEFVYSQANR